MPAAYAHYTFGKKVFRLLPKDIRTFIRENREAYMIGLHGPDLLFFYHCYKSNRLTKMGDALHLKYASELLNHGRDLYQKDRDPKLLAYMLGYICHFALDSECHPYIADYMKANNMIHSSIETDFDRMLIRREGRDPAVINQTAHLVRDPKTEIAIASFYDNVTVKEIDDALVDFHLVSRLFQCRTRTKEEIIRKLCHILHKEDFIVGLITTGEEIEGCEESTAELDRRLNKAVPIGAKLIEEYIQKIDTDETLSARFDRDFETFEGYADEA